MVMELGEDVGTWATIKAHGGDRARMNLAPTDGDGVR